MKLVDTNVWLALALMGHEYHVAAHAWLATISTAGEVLFCRSTQQSLLRLLTTDAILSRYGAPALNNKEAWSAYQAFRGDSRIDFAVEPVALEQTWMRLAARETTSPKLWMDAYLAAFAMAGGHQLVTIDTAFQQFPGLDVLVLSAGT